MARRFQILSLSGGGFRGLHVARTIELIEAELGDRRIADHFDLLAGTSVGGIIALALGLRIPAKTIRESLETAGPKLFPQQPPSFAALRQLAKAPGKLGKLVKGIALYGEIQADVEACESAWYDPAPLRTLLSADEYFGTRTLADLKHPVIVPAVNYTKGEAKFFKTDHHPNFTFDRRLRIIDVALGTSAAPVYFPVHKVDDWRIVDGGLVANDPTQVAVHEAMMFFGVRPALYGDSNPTADDLRVLAVGTLSPKRFADVSTSLDKGLFEWGAGAFELAMSAQEVMSATMVDKHMLPGKVIRLPSMEARPETAPGLADASPVSSEILRASALDLTQKAFGRDEFRELFQHQARSLQEVRSLS